MTAKNEAMQRFLDEWLRTHCRVCDKPLSSNATRRGHRTCSECRKEARKLREEMRDAGKTLQAAREATAEFRSLYGAQAITAGPARFWR